VAAQLVYDVAATGGATGSSAPGFTSFKRLAGVADAADLPAYLASRIARRAASLLIAYSPGRQ
jgi:hypothetical protein